VGVQCLRMQSVSKKMEDVIKKSGGTFGNNEAMILSQLSLAAIPTAVIVFLDMVTRRSPQVCVYNAEHECIPVADTMAQSVCAMQADNWTYVDPDSSIIAGFNMLCLPKFYLILTDLLFYLGMFAGCCMAGVISDVLGRKPTLMLFLFAETVFTGLMILACDYAVWTLLRFLTGIGIGYFVVCKVLIIESLKIHYRHMFLGVVWAMFAVGILCLSLMDLWFERYIDILACTTVYLAFLWLMYLFGIEESLRWLLVKRKSEDATYLLTKIEYRNKITLPKYEDIPRPRDDEYTFCDVFTQSKWLIILLVKIMIVSFYYMVTYTSLLDIRVLYKSHETEEEATSVNLSIIGCLHLLGVLFSSTSSHFLGRRFTATTQILLILIMLVLSTILYGDVKIGLLCAMGIRCCSAGLLYFCSLYSLELFASPFRAKAVVLILVSGSLGGMATAVTGLVTEFLQWELEEEMQYIVQATVVLGLLILSLSLRETKDRAMPEKIEQMPTALPVTRWLSCGNEEHQPLLDKSKPQSEETKD